MNLDILESRRQRYYSKQEMVGRFAWSIARWTFRFSPRTAFGWRSWLLRLFGAKIGRNVNIYPSVQVAIPWLLSVGDDVAIGERVFIYNLGRCEIGDRATISHGAHLCGGTHDFTLPHLPLIRSEIHIGSEAWICADAFVGPGVRIGQRAIAGARSVVVRDVADHEIVAGNPSKKVGLRSVHESPTNHS